MHSRETLGQTCSWGSLTHLEVDHVPEALQITARDLLHSRPELTVVNKTSELFESLGHEQLRLTYGCSYAATYCNHRQQTQPYVNYISNAIYSTCHHISDKILSHFKKNYAHNKIITYSVYCILPQLPSYCYRFWEINYIFPQTDLSVCHDDYNDDDDNWHFLMAKFFNNIRSATGTL